MGSQMLWSRFLSLIIHNSVYTYTITLSVVLSGLALGSLISARLTRRITDFSKTLGIIISLELTFFILALFLPASIWQSIAEDHSPLLRVVLISGIMLLPTLLSGMTFPFLLMMVDGGKKLRGRVAGLLSFSNTIGGILGSLLVGFILLPLLGIGWTILGIIAIMSILVVVAFNAASRKLRKTWLILGLPLITLIFMFKSPTKFISSYVKHTPGNYLDHLEVS